MKADVLYAKKEDILLEIVKKMWEIFFIGKRENNMENIVIVQVTHLQDLEIENQEEKEDIE